MVDGPASFVAMAQLTEQQRALLAAANMPATDDDDGPDPAEVAEAVADAVGDTAEAVAVAVADEAPDPVVVLEVEAPDPMAQAEAAAVVIAAEAAADVQRTEASSEAEVAYVEAHAEGEAQVVDALPDEAFTEDTAPRTGHGWFRSFRG